MDDDSHSLDGKIQYAVIGTAPNRRLIVVWYHRTHYRHRGDAGASNTDYISIEAKIFETTGVIEFHYNDLVYDTDGDIAEDYDWFSSATVGIKKDETTYDEYHYSTEDDPPQVDVDHNLLAIRYSPNPSSGTELYIAGGTGIIMQNNIMRSIDDGGTSPYYVIQAPAGAISAFNYNDVYKGTNTNLAKIGGTDYADLTSWGIGGSGNIETDPKFVDPNNGDFHIKSSAAGASFHNGEWPPLTAGAGVWTADNDISPNVDTGDPAAAYNLEQPDNGSRLNIGVYGNTLQATKTAVLVGIWTGAVDTVWNVPNNWSDAVVPTGSCVTGPGSNATIPDVSAESGNFPYISNIAEVDDITIDANAYLTILPDAGLTVCGTLTNNNGVNGIFINSDATGDGSLIHSTAGVDATIYRYLGGTQYHYISSPISNATTAAIGIQGGTNGVQFYDWDATISWGGMGATPPSTIDYTPWDVNNPVSGALNVGTGYAYYYYPSTLTFSGTTNISNYTYTLHKAATGTVSDQGWNFLGNPYTASLDWDAVGADLPNNSNIEGAVYLFDDSDGSGSQANYRYYVPADPGTGGAYGIGTGDATKNIPVGQGFFVRTATDGENITINAANRVHSTQDYYKEIHNNLLRLSVENDYSSDELIVRFIKPASKNFDKKFDARKLIPSNPEIPQIFSILNDGTMSAINSMPELNKSFDIPLTFICVEGNFKIKISEYNFEDVRIYLEDKLKNKSILLSQNSEYSFTHQGGVSSDRFVLHFVKNTTPYINDYIPDQFATNSLPFEYTIKENVFKDDDFGDVLTYTANLAEGEQLPEWLHFDSKTRTFSSVLPQVGVYEITVTAYDLSGETVEDDFILTVYNSYSGINDIKSDIKIYPNPSKGVFNVISNKDISPEMIKITDVTGKVIYLRNDVSSIPKQIKILNKKAGIYFLNIYLENKTLYYKLVIE